MLCSVSVSNVFPLKLCKFRILCKFRLPRGGGGGGAAGDLVLERVDDSACHLFILWLLNCICLCFTFVSEP